MSYPSHRIHLGGSTNICISPRPTLSCNSLSLHTWCSPSRNAPGPRIHTVLRCRRSLGATRACAYDEPTSGTASSDVRRECSLLTGLRSPCPGAPTPPTAMIGTGLEDSVGPLSHLGSQGNAFLGRPEGKLLVPHSPPSLAFVRSLRIFRVRCVRQR